MDLSVNICGVEFKNPVIAASGTFAYGEEFERFYPLSELGGISTKGIFIKPRMGNKPPRIAEAASGIINSVGLPGPGVDAFLANELPRLKNQNTVVIVNVAGNDIDEYKEIVERVSVDGVGMIEVNISCPNLKENGTVFGASCETVAAVTKAVKAVAKKPVIIKLSPSVSDIASIAKAAEAEGADALSLINTITAMKIDVHTRRPILANNVGGLSGSCVKPIAVRMVWQCANAVKIPIIGMGGIYSGEDAVEFLLAGASAVSVGSAILSDPYAPLKVCDELGEYMRKYGIKKVSELVGKIELN